MRDADLDIDKGMELRKESTSTLLGVKEILRRTQDEKKTECRKVQKKRGDNAESTYQREKFLN